MLDGGDDVEHRQPLDPFGEVERQAVRDARAAVVAGEAGSAHGRSCVITAAMSAAIATLA